MNIHEILKRLQTFAPLALAESWDNVGLLIEPPQIKTISKIMLTNDLTEDVMDESEEKKVNMILSYHPPIFRPLKFITRSNWKERIVGRCIAGGIALYSPHTCFDALKGGVNDWLIQPFGHGVVVPLQPSSTLNYGLQVQIRCQNCDASFNELKESLSTKIDITDRLNFHLDSTCAYLYCDERDLMTVVSCIYACETKYLMFINKLEKVPSFDQGMGRLKTLQSPLQLSECVEIIKTHLNLKHVRLAVGRGSSLATSIKSVAVCAGAGVSVLRGAKADLMLTGEMSHHEVLDFVHKGSSVILVDHSNSERGFLKTLKPTLVQLFDNKVNVVISESDRDPLVVV